MSRSSRFLSIAVLAVAAAASAFSSAAVAFGDYVVAAVHRAWGFMMDGFGPEVSVKPMSPSQRKPSVALVAAKAFVLRMVKRYRPNVTPMWRMCPST